jgi:hypothetical protein
MHILASYYGKIVPGQESHGIPPKVSEMGRDMPEIIMANLHQLVRRYQNAMTWMTMGLNDPNHLTRWEKFRVSVLSTSAITNHMKNVKSSVSSEAGGNKYGWINYNNTGFNQNTGDINRLHVEFRAADGLMSASAAAAIACMYYALIIKAITVSRYGVTEIGDNKWLRQALAIKEAMLNGRGSYSGGRLSDTSYLSQYYDILIEESMDLARQLKPILIKVGPAYEVLEKLAEKPVALRRVEGHDWKRIENDLAVIISEEDVFDIAIDEIISLELIVDCKTLEEWVTMVGQELRKKEKAVAGNEEYVENKIRFYVNRNQEEGNLVWSHKIGAPMLI